MIVHNGFENLNLKNPVVTIGIFDGVHLGHRAIIERLISRSREINGESVVITFHPHPRLVLENEPENISFLSTMEEKTALLEMAGVEHLIIIEFNTQLRTMKAADFVKDILASRVRTRYLIVGHDHHFGYGGEGNYDTIIDCAGSVNFEVEQVRGLKAGNIIISSTLIREALFQGKLEEANSWLGYNYFLKGIVVEGKKIGRKLGYPTANIKPGYIHKLIPADGVYAVEVQLENKRMKAMLSIGFNPTVSEPAGERSIEVHIFDFEKNIYGKGIEIIFRYRLRDEVKFKNTEQLSRQIELDRTNALRLLD